MLSCRQRPRCFLGATAQCIAGCRRQFASAFGERVLAGFLDTYLLPDLVDQLILDRDDGAIEAELNLGAFCVDHGEAEVFDRSRASAAVFCGPALNALLGKDVGFRDAARRHLGTVRGLLADPMTGTSPQRRKLANATSIRTESQ